ncbi:MAG TPA: hypothetical protein VIK27_08870 [Candidatus Aquilonibacter sp.]
MDDPLSRALAEAPEKYVYPTPDVVDRRTPARRKLPDILDEVKKQAIDALMLPFFDGGVGDHSEPIVRSGVSEAGTVHVSAHRVEPPYRAHLTMYVRSDIESPHAGNFQVRAHCEVSSDVQKPSLRRAFPIGVNIADDGTHTIDVARLRAEMADTIRSFGKRSQDLGSRAAVRHS